MPFKLDQLPDRQFIVRFDNPETPPDESSVFCIAGFGEQGRTNAELILAAIEAIEEIAGEEAFSFLDPHHPLDANGAELWQPCPTCKTMIELARKAKTGERVKRHE